ncbi:MAG: exopolysaccharide transport family protein [Loktanella sp.]|nr:exopolysaccharide transport family protein [Loktanella sp.]
MSAGTSAKGAVRAGGDGEPSILSLAWSNKVAISLCGLAAALTAYIALSTVTPTYTARTQVLLEQNATSVMDQSAGAAGQRITPAEAQSTIIVMESTDVLRSVAEELELTNRAEFNSELRESGLLDTVKSELRDLVSGVVPAGEPEEGALRIAPDDPLAGVIRELRKAVEIRVMGESAIVEVRAMTQNPSLAAAITDAVAENYIAQQLVQKYESAVRATEWLEDRTEQLRIVLQDADARVTDFRSEQLSAGAQTVADIEPRLEELTRQIARVGAELSDTRAQRDELLQLYEEDNFMSLVPLFGIASITALHQELLVAETELVDRTARFGDDPSVTAQRQVRDGVRTRLEAEVRNALAGLDVRVDVLSKRLINAEEDLQAMRRELVDRQQTELRLTELERESEASQQVYNRFLVEVKEVRERSQFQTPAARIITWADVPVAPTAPQKAKMAVVAGLGGGALALLLIALLRDNRPRVRNAEELAEMTGVDAIEQIPAPGAAGAPLALLERMRAEPESPGAQSLRWLRYRLRARRKGQTNVILVTSARAETGKSGISVALAETFASDGVSTVLVNIDGQATDLLSIDSVGALRDMPFRYLDYTEHTMRALNECAGEAAGDLADRLRILKSTDVIIINGPSVLRSADALEMSEMASRVLLVCNWNETPSALVQQSVNVLRDAGSRVDAIAMNNVPRRSLKPVTYMPRSPQPPKAIAAPQG